MDHRPPRGKYRGRRRVSAPPRNRYAAVVTTAFVGAGVMALTATHTFHDLKSGAGYTTAEGAYDGGAGGGDLGAGPRGAGDRAGRGTDRNQMVTLEQGKADYWRLPMAKYEVSSPWGFRYVFGAPQIHNGFDMANPCGTPYYAVADGTIILADFNGGYGLNIQIDHGNGVHSIYGHSSRIVVSKGQKVKAGQLIGYVGTTGYSTGCHLHLGIELNGILIDPAPYVLKHGVDLFNKSDVTTGG